MFTLHHSRCLPLETLCKYQQKSETKICHTLHTGGDLPKKAMQKIISSHFQLIAAPLTFSSHTAISNHRNDQAATLKVSNIHLVHFLLAHKFTHRLPLSRIMLSHWSARGYIRRNFNDLISCWTSSFTCYFSDFWLSMAHSGLFLSLDRVDMDFMCQLFCIFGTPLVT